MNWKEILKACFGKRSSVPTIDADDLISSFAAEVRSKTLNEETRTVQAVAVTDNPVLMYDAARREVVEEILVADGGSFPERIPLIDSHDRTSVFNVFGSAINAIREGGKWLLTLEFDDDDPSERVFSKVRKRHITDVSIGYNVDYSQVVYIARGQTKTVGGVSYTAGDYVRKICPVWFGTELSVTPIGADRTAKIRAFAMLQAPAKRHDELAAELDDLIVDTGLPRDEVINDMASAAGISASDVNEILTGDVAPDSDQLDGFAAALETETEPLAQLI